MSSPGGPGEWSTNLIVSIRELKGFLNLKINNLSINSSNNNKTSLLRKLQAQTLPNATPPIGQIQPLSKMAVTFEPLKRF